MAFFTVCVLMVRRPRGDDLVTESPVKLSWESLGKQTTLGSSLDSSAPTLGGLLFGKVSHAGWLHLLLLRHNSLLLLLFLQLLDGVHRSPGAHLAHRGRVLALHHQFVGHLIVSLQEPGEE